MRKLLNNPFVSGALALAAIALVAHSLMDGSSDHKGSSIADAAASPASDDIAAENEGEPFSETLDAGQPTIASFDSNAVFALASQSATRNLFSQPAASLSQPEVPTDPVKQTLATATLRVKGVWIQGGLRYVVIDDELLRAGQSLDRVQVERIEPQGVWITHEAKSHFVQPGESWSYQYPATEDVARN